MYGFIVAAVLFTNVVQWEFVFVQTQQSYSGIFFPEGFLNILASTSPPPHVARRCACRDRESRNRTRLVEYVPLSHVSSSGKKSAQAAQQVWNAGAFLWNYNRVAEKRRCVDDGRCSVGRRRDTICTVSGPARQTQVRGVQRRFSIILRSLPSSEGAETFHRFFWLRYETNERDIDFTKMCGFVRANTRLVRNRSTYRYRSA